MKKTFNVLGCWFPQALTKRIGEFPPLILFLIAATPLLNGQTLGEALNATNLTWTTSGANGASGWSVQNGVTHDGESAARGGLVSSSSQTSTLQTTVMGPGKLVYWWYSASSDFSTLTFSVNGVSRASIFSWGQWKQETFFLDSGSQVLRWTNSASTGSGYGYLDEVTYSPGVFAPEITTQPVGQSQVPGLDTMCAVIAQGSPPLSYQWQFNETNIVAATNSSMIISNTQPDDLGNYRLIVTNSAGSVTSSVVALEFGEVAAWGKLGLVGWATATNGLINIISIAAAESHDLAVNRGGHVLAWGPENRYSELSTPDSLPASINAKAGLWSSAALSSAGEVALWGSAGFGATAVTNPPQGLSNVVSVSLGQAHALALRHDGSVLSWGNIPAGQTNVAPGLSNVVAVAAGRYHSLALKSDGKVVAWGYNSFTETNVPVGLSNVVAIAGGDRFSVALKSDGKLSQWGITPSPAVASSLSNIVAIAAGHGHAIALRYNGTVVAWGNNLYGQTNVPPQLTNVVAVSAAASHSLALVGNGPPVANAAMTNPALSSNGFSATVPSQSGRVYSLEYKSSLADADWTPLPLVAGNGTNLVLADPTATNSQRVYRVRRW
jgi:alpha-tubulin suppressor-like RCC1 family protein